MIDAATKRVINLNLRAFVVCIALVAASVTLLASVPVEDWLILQRQEWLGAFSQLSQAVIGIFLSGFIPVAATYAFGEPLSFDRLAVTLSVLMCAYMVAPVVLGFHVDFAVWSHEINTLSTFGSAFAEVFLWASALRIFILLIGRVRRFIWPEQN